ncbi:MAG: hypothetical protein J7M14_04500 [Planctomycetes bacterium]|nr:hypothetical protein [Planctomycetota bacterium]
MVAACVFTGMLSIRTLTSLDLGYHLAYGQEFLRTLRPVDHTPELYTLPDASTPAEERPEPGPGCWYDEQGRYRFPNANWLCQVVMAGVWGVAGPVGFSIFSAAAMFGWLLLCMLLMRRLGVSRPWAAGGMIVIAMTFYLRSAMRPELMGYLLLALQGCLLSEAFLKVHRGYSLSVRRGLCLIGVQLLFVNMHSYFLLGLVLTGALLFDQLVRWLWRRARGRGENPYGRAALTTSSVLAGQVAVCFANPWTWRLAILPIQTVFYLRRYGVMTADSTHPWGWIGEFRRPLLSPGFPGTPADYVLCAVFVLAAAGLLAAVMRRRWVFAAVLGAGVMLALSMRRNVTPAATLVVPTALSCLAALVGVIGRWRRHSSGRERFSRIRSHVTLILAGAVVVTGCWGSWAVVTNRMYYPGHAVRFGLGVSRMNVPVSAAEWLNENLPDERVWCTFAGSSTLYFFTRPRRPLPTLTNTWAYPPSLMQRERYYRNMSSAAGTLNARMAEFSREFGATVVLLRLDWSRGFFLALAKHEDWAPVHIDGMYVIFARRTGRSGELVNKLALIPEKLRGPGLIERLRDADPAGAPGLITAGNVYTFLGWYDLAREVLAAAISDYPEDPSGPYWLGVTYFEKAKSRRRAGDAGYIDDVKRAEKSFADALRIDSGYKKAMRRMNEIRRNTRRHGPAPRR